MTRKRRISKPAPVATMASKGATTIPTLQYSPARNTRSAASHVSTIMTPPAHVKTAPALPHDLPVLSPPLKKRVHARGDARGVKVPSLEEALDDFDAEFGTQVSSSNNSALRHDVKPDPHLPEPYRRSARVLMHKDSIYDAMLTRARVHQNQCEFIALQALEHEQQFFLWQRSGSIGYAGKTLLVGPFECEERVVLEFCTVFSAKTSCTWEERHSLEYQEGSYTWIELDYSMGTPYADVVPAALDGTSDCDDAAPLRGQKRRRASRASSLSSSSSSASAPSRQYNFVQDWATSTSSSVSSAGSIGSKPTALPASRLHADVQAFLTLIANPNEPHQTAYSSYSETDEVMEEAQKMPLGRLSKTTIQRGYETLEKIYEALQSRAPCRTRILHLSSHFYSIIPHHSRLDVIDTMVKLGHRVATMARVCEHVRGMSAMEIVARCQQRNYLDECYNLLACDLVPLDESSREFARVQAYVKNANCCGWKDGTLQLQQVFRVTKRDEAARFAPFAEFPNRKILWHGSRMSNWLGILSDGLRIAPPDVASNGRIFGKGIYFTDKASKAQAYCHASARHGPLSKCVFVLSEVALGAVKEMVASDESAKRHVHVSCGGHAKAASAFNSCKGVGTCRPDARGDVEDDVTGAIWPLGTPAQDTETTGLNHSEYIIYNPAQARMRYVVVAKTAY